MTQDEAGSELSPEIRHQLVVLAGRSGSRIAEFTPKAPTKWNPYQVLNPETKLPFTDTSAWQLIADELKSGCEVELIWLDKPPGKRGYVLYKKLQVDRPRLYIKLQLGSGYVIGRSFHYEEVGK